MEFDPKDRQIVELLTKVKNANGGYPPGMLESRRQSYLKSITGAGLGAGIDTGHKNVSKNGNSAGFPGTAGKLLEIVLVVAIVAEAGALAYFYRDKLADIFRTSSPESSVQEITSPPVITSPLPELEISETSISAFPTGTGTVTVLPSGTPIPGLTEDLIINNDGGVNPADSTPVPNGNNGNHYGQTPKPERTKENDNNNDKPPKDKPPKDNKGK